MAGYMILQTNISILAALMNLEGGGQGLSIQNIFEDAVNVQEARTQIAPSYEISNDRTHLKNYNSGI